MFLPSMVGLGFLFLYSQIVMNNVDVYGNNFSHSCKMIPFSGHHVIHPDHPRTRRSGKKPV